MKYEVAPNVQVTVKKTTPKAVKAYREELARYLDDEANAEKDVMEATFHMLPYAVDGDLSTLEYDDFYPKEAEKAIADFLPRGMETLRMLSGI